MVTMNCDYEYHRTATVSLGCFQNEIDDWWNEIDDVLIILSISSNGTISAQ